MEYMFYRLTGNTDRDIFYLNSLAHNGWRVICAADVGFLLLGKESKNGK